MAGRKQNPIKDITDTVSAWLGGNRGTINPQVQRTISQTKRAAKTIDQFATGGLGAAAVADAQRMAASGSSTPSALYKTAAVNLAAGAAAAKAAQVVAKGAGKVVAGEYGLGRRVTRLANNPAPKQSFPIRKPDVDFMRTFGMSDIERLARLRLQRLAASNKDFVMRPAAYNREILNAGQQLEQQQLSRRYLREKGRAIRQDIDPNYDPTNLLPIRREKVNRKLNEQLTRSQLRNISEQNKKTRKR